MPDENTSHRLVDACCRLTPGFPIVHIAKWRDGAWLGLDDTALLVECSDANLVLVAFDRATLPWHAAQVLRAGASHGGLVLFRRMVRTTDYGMQSRLLCGFCAGESHSWDWRNRIVYLPTSPRIASQSAGAELQGRGNTVRE